MSFFKATDQTDDFVTQQAQRAEAPLLVSGMGDTFSAQWRDTFNATYFGQNNIENKYFKPENVQDGNDYSNLLDLYRGNAAGTLTKEQLDEYNTKKATWDAYAFRIPGFKTIDAVAEEINKQYRKDHDTAILAEGTSKGFLSGLSSFAGALTGDVAMLPTLALGTVATGGGIVAASAANAALNASLMGTLAFWNREAKETRALAIGEDAGSLAGDIAFQAGLGGLAGGIAGGLAAKMRLKYAALPDDSPINKEVGENIAKIQELKDRGIKLTPEQEAAHRDAVDLADAAVTKPEFLTQAQHLAKMKKAGDELFGYDESIHYKQNDRTLQVGRELTGQNRELAPDELAKLTENDLAHYNIAEQRDFEANLRGLGDTGSPMGTDAATLPKEIDTPEVRKLFANKEELTDAEYAKATKTLDDYRNGKSEEPISDLDSFISKARTDVTTKVDVLNSKGVSKEVTLSKAVRTIDDEHKAARQLKECLLNFGGSASGTI